MFVCCAGDHPAPRQCGHQQKLGPVFPWYELCGDGVAMVRMQPGVGSVEQAQVRNQPELHFTITESLFKVFVRVLIAIAKQMTRTISCCHDISLCSTPVRTSPWQFFSIFTSINIS